MGMDYRYAGSASYPRFEEELRLVAKELGCAETGYLGELEQASGRKPLGYWFGCMYNSDKRRAKFDVPDSLPESVAKWLNDPYDERSPEETAEIWEAVKDRPGIRALSSQIYSELEWLARWHEGWHIA